MTLVTCEHAGNQVPIPYRHLFSQNPEVLDTHRGWDPGAWDAASILASAVEVEAHANFVSRLVIEVNRSLNHHQLFSEFSSALTEEEKHRLIDKIYLAYRVPLEESIRESAEPVTHLSIHSFVPVLNGSVRQLEIGLLFDPLRNSEFDFCENLQHELGKQLPHLRVIFNEPYQGIDDGFTTYLRGIFSNDHYRGIEIELNQRMMAEAEWTQVKTKLGAAIRKVTNQLN